MYLEKVQGMVDIIQDKRRKLVATLPNTEENRELPQVGKVYEPGKTGIRVKKGYLLLDVINVPKRKFAIQIKDNQTSVSDFLGVHPLVGVVYEVYEKEEFFKVGDVVLLSQSVSRPGGIQSVVTNGCVAQLVYEGDVLCVDNNLTKFE